jgi:hypothetical protein
MIKKEFKSKLKEDKSIEKKQVYGAEKIEEKLESPTQKYKPEEKESLQIPKKKFTKQIVERIKEKNLPKIISQEKIKPQIKEESANIIENTEKETPIKISIKRLAKRLLRKKRNIGDIKEMFEENPETQIKTNSKQYIAKEKPAEEKKQNSSKTFFN